MKIIKKLMFACAVLFTVFCVYADTETVNGITWTYTVSDGKASVDDVSGSISGSVRIPSTLGGCPVASIRDYAFFDCYSLTSVTIPDGVTSIGDDAFYGCRSLTSVTIPDSVTSIGNSAFSGCYSLTSVTIPDSVTSIGNSAFSDCYSLTSITIPDSVTSIGWDAFWGCARLADGQGFVIIRDVLYYYCGDNDVVTIPDSVTSIGSFAFYGCRSLTSVTIPDSVTSIGDWAFSDCKSLTSVTIPDSVTSIGWDAFSNCKDLASAKVPLAFKEQVENECVFVFCSNVLVVEYYCVATFDANGGEFFDETKRYVTVGTPIGSLSAPTREGYEFFGWFTAAEGGTHVTADTVVTGDMTLYALWREKMYTPSQLFGGEWISGASGTASANGYDDSTIGSGASVKFDAESDSSVWIELEVVNSCRVAFNWKSSCEGLVKGSPYDYLSFEIDGELKGFICGESDWDEMSFDVVGEGVHRLRWTFRRDDEGDGGANCAWLADVDITHVLSVRFDAGGATDGVVPGLLEYYEDDNVELPGSGSLLWPKHTFVGWSDGNETYKPGDAYSSESDALLTAVWTRNELDVPVISGPEMFEADFCTVEISSASGAAIHYTLDGTDPTAVSALCTGPITVQQTTTIKAIAVKDNYFDSQVVEFTVTRGVWTFGEYLNCPSMQFTTGGDAEWTRVKGVSEDGYALRSGDITHSQSSRLEVVVSGPGTIAFKCRVEGEVVKKTVWDGLSLSIDGAQQGDLMGDEEWITKTFTVTGSGSHTITWAYVKDDSDIYNFGEDCAWLDEVVWTPAPTGVTVDVGGGKNVVVPVEWIDSHTDIVAAAGGDKAAALRRTAANGRKVWECFMLGVDPTNANDDFKITRFWMENGVPKFEFSHSVDGAGNSFIPRIKPLGKAELSDVWQAVPPAGNESFRFFTVEVELP